MRVPRPAASSVAREVTAFLAAGLLALLALGGLLAWAEHRSAVGEAVQVARDLTAQDARTVVAPQLTEAALRPGPSYDRLDRAVRDRVLSRSVVRVKIWDASGQVLYSDDRALVGRRFRLDDDELAALQGGPAVAGPTDLREEENLDERQFGRLLQVYLGVRTTSGRPLLFETYQSYAPVEQLSRRIWRGTLPVLVGGLLLLELLQAPLAWRMARRLRAAQEEREQLLLVSLAASDRERARIAADLHDGVVQGLTGASYALSAAADSPGEGLRDASRQTARDLRRWVRELRSLVVTVTPPALRADGLLGPLADLLATLEHRGTHVSLVADELPELPLDATSLAYRVAQEAVRNVVRHAGARRVDAEVRVEAGSLVLRVVDDGRGFDPAAVSRRSGSVGLELLAHVVEAQGGRLDVATGPGAGTAVTLTLPLPPAAPPEQPVTRGRRLRRSPAPRTAAAPSAPAPAARGRR